MNTNSNAYTIVYTSIIVILSAAILAIASQALKPRQDANIKADTISQMMTAAQFKTEGLSNDAIISLYKGAIKESFIIDNKGGKVSDMDKASSEIFSTSKLKAQNSILKRGKADQMKLPVYVFNKDGKDITVIPVYGAGLWGPIWGYLALEPDMKTLAGAFFNHESETPGLGAKIKDDPSFRARFVGKSIDRTSAATVTSPTTFVSHVARTASSASPFAVPLNQVSGAASTCPAKAMAEKRTIVFMCARGFLMTISP